MYVNKDFQSCALKLSELRLSHNSPHRMRFSATRGHQCENEAVQSYLRF